MKMISKKIAIYIIVGMLSVTATMNAYSLGVHATGFEWVGGAIAFEEAIKWLLASVGIVSAGGMTADYWEQHGDEFVDYCTEQNITNTEVAEWQMKLCHGILDKGSVCWSAFKSWAKSLVSSGSGSGSISLVSGVSTSRECIEFLNDYLDLNLNSISVSDNVPVYGFVLCSYADNNSNYNIYLLTSDNDYNISLENGSYKFIYSNSSFQLLQIIVITNSYCNQNGGILTSNRYDNRYIYNYSSTQNLVLWNVSPGIGLSSYDLINSGSSDSDFVGLQGVDQTTLDVIDSDLPDENASEVTIPMPGVADSDNTASADAYDDIVDLINDGTITIDDGLERIQGLLKIITYDTVTDDVIPIQPDPDTGENKKKDDVVNENKDNMAFTLGGLETVFPFCIPWDIYAFLSILEAEPEAPKFNFPFRDPTTHQDVFYEVDLSVFEPVAVVTRYGADLIFIIGLALATRKLIGAGGGD